jgi:hypothetical protein
MIHDNLQRVSIDRRWACSNLRGLSQVCLSFSYKHWLSQGCRTTDILNFSLGIAFVTTEVYQFSMEMAVPSSLKLVFFGLLISLVSGVVTGLDVGGLAGGAGGAGGGGLVKPASGLGGAGERSLKSTDSP